MGTSLQIRKVSLGGIDKPHSWEFPQGVTVIAGDSGGGKTSLLNLIKYGLGGKAPITSTVRGAAKGVILDVQLGGREIQLTRKFASRKGIIEVREGDQPPIEYGVAREKKRPWISDLLLDELGIPTVRVPQSQSSASHKLTSISFQDVLAYCYLDQDEIDRSTVFDNESPGRGPKRPRTFELLFGLMDSTVAGIEVEREEVAQERDDREERLSSIEGFLEARHVPGSFAEVSARLREVESEIERTETEISLTEEELQQAITVVAASRDRFSEQDEQLVSAEAKKRRIHSEREEIDRVVNQLERDIQVVAQGQLAGAVLDPIDYEICPRCEQQLAGRSVEPTHCPVCLQDDSKLGYPAESGPLDLREQLQETLTLIDQLSDSEAVAEEEVERVRDSLDRERRAFARATDEASLPFRSRIGELQDRLGQLRGERQTLSAGLPLERALSQERQEIIETEPKISLLHDRADRRREELSPSRVRVEELSDTFDEILRRLTLPWLTSAEVDQKTYLPFVNGLGLRELSSGGMKTTTNVAYYLAIFVMGLRDEGILVPSFLMLDSIRKASGSGKEDLARSERIYEYLQTLQRMRKPPNPLPRDFQLIVVDNDMPDQFRSSFNTIRIDLENPLIRS